MEAREDRFQITKEHDLNHIFEEERQVGYKLGQEVYTNLYEFS